MKNLIKVLFVIISISLIGYSTFITVKALLPNKKPKINIDINIPKVKTNNLSMIMVGDALIHEAVYVDAKTSQGYDFKPMFSEVKEIINKYDLKYYNQETILGGKEIGLSTYPRFNSPYEVGDAFLDMGFNLVSLSNNHTLDRGYDAIKNSRKYWNSKDGVIAIGSATTKEEEQKDKARILEKNGITYAMLAYTTTTNGLSSYGDTFLVSEFDEEQVKKDVEALRDKVDVLMVSMHWGEEYTHVPTNQEKEIAKYLASLDVDIVIGSHPHVIQPIEYIDDTLIIYSLGNFISAQLYTYQLTGVMVSVNISQNEVDGIGLDLNVSDTTAELIYTCRSDKCGEYKVYPYSKLNDNILSGYKNEYKDFSSVLTEYDKNIKVVGLE